MKEIFPYFTNDGSVGLFSPEDDDIYHSTYGALTEAYEKFILPSNIENCLKKNKEIKILDICFGIGYNTKSAINKILDLHYNEAIDNNNNLCKNNNIDKIHNDNDLFKVFIHAIDVDKNLAHLSPFFITDKKLTKKEKLSFSQEKISKMLSEKIVQRFKLKKEVNYLLLKSIFELIDAETEEILFSKKYSRYFDKNIINLYRFYKLKRIVYNPILKLYAFLHNI